MQSSGRNLLSAMVALGTCFALASSAGAQLYGPGSASLSTFAYMDAGNISADGSGNVSALYTAVQYSPTGQPVSVTSSVNFTGNDSNGVQQTMTHSGTAMAAADYGVLHASATGELDNPYYNSANKPYFTGYGPGGQSNPDGSPQYLQVVGQAIFNDTLTLNPTVDPIVALRYQFHVDGSVTNTQDSYAFLSFAAGSNSIVFETTSTTDWSTPDWNVTPGAPIPIGGSFGAVFGVNTADTPEGVTVSGTSDFYNTLTLTGIQLLDANGNPVNGATYLTASGTHYNIVGATYGPAATPEPGCIAYIVGVGVVGAAWRRR
jgi:hypothetical protein